MSHALNRLHVSQMRLLQVTTVRTMTTETIMVVGIQIDSQTDSLWRGTAATLQLRWQTYHSAQMTIKQCMCRCNCRCEVQQRRRHVEKRRVTDTLVAGTAGKNLGFLTKNRFLGFLIYKCRTQNYDPQAQWKVKTSPVSKDATTWTPQIAIHIWI